MRQDEPAAPVGAAAPTPDAPVLASAGAASCSVRLGEQWVAYALNRRRRRSIGFVVGPAGLTVNAPGWIGRDAIEAALQAKARWILSKLGEQRERVDRAAADRIDWRDGATLAVVGRPVVVTLTGRGAAGLVEAPPRRGAAASVETPARRGAAGLGETPGDAAVQLRLPLPPEAPPAAIEAAACRWLKAEAGRVFAERCAHYAPRLGVQPKALRLSSARTRWGSASADGTIRLNWRLVHLPVESIDYVVVHELAHLREMNHGPRFWALVEATLPGYEAVRRALRRASPVLAVGTV